MAKGFIAFTKFKKIFSTFIVVENFIGFIEHPFSGMLPKKINSLFGSPMLTTKRMVCAVAIAVSADVLQILLLPFAWTFAESAVDCVVMILMVRLLGFHLLLLPTFVVEFIPVVDMLPTWTACVIAVIIWRKREQRGSVPPVPPDKPIIDI